MISGWAQLEVEMKAVELHDVLFRAILGRALSDNEKEAVAARYGDNDVDPATVGAEIARSDEFFGRHRESFVNWQFPRSTVVTAKGPLGHQIHCDLRQLHLGLSMACGHYEPDETAFILKTVKRGMTVLDVGANIGFFTTMLAGLVGDSGKVIALEPVADTFQKLKSAVALNRLDNIVELHNVAASTGDGTCELAYDMHSFNMGGVSMRPTGSETARQISQIAPTRSIDDIVWGRPIDFIKMDIEGAEAFALSGAEKTIASNRPVIIMEFNQGQLKQVSDIDGIDLFTRVIDLGYTANKLFNGGETAALQEGRLREQLDAGEIVNVVFTAQPTQ